MRSAVALCGVLCALVPARLAAQQPCDTAQAFTTLEERVVDLMTRMPLSGVNVTISWHARGGEQKLHLLTDSAGRTRACVPAGTALNVHAKYFDKATSAPPIIANAPGTTRHMTALDAPGYLVRGAIVDLATGLPVPNVSVRVGSSGPTYITDASGRFLFPRVPMGDYDLVVEHIAYAPNMARLHIRDDDIEAAVRLTPRAIPLAPIVVTAFSRHLDRVGFYERQRRGIGTFITRKQIEDMDVQRGSELLRGIPGLRLIMPPQRRGPPQQQTVGRNNCRFKFVVDGSRTLPDFEMDNIAPYFVEGVEVYAGVAEVPPEFKAIAGEFAGGTCGVIAVWTRDGR